MPLGALHPRTQAFSSKHTEVSKNRGRVCFNAVQRGEGAGFGGEVGPTLCLALEKGLDKVRFKYSSTLSKGVEIDCVHLSRIVGRVLHYRGRGTGFDLLTLIFLPKLNTYPIGKLFLFFIGISFVVEAEKYKQRNKQTKAVCHHAPPPPFFAKIKFPPKKSNFKGDTRDSITIRNV